MATRSKTVVGTALYIVGGRTPRDHTRYQTSIMGGSKCSEAPPIWGGSCALGHRPSLSSTALSADRRKLPPAWGVRAGERR